MKTKMITLLLSLCLATTTVAGTYSNNESQSSQEGEELPRDTKSPQKKDHQEVAGTHGSGGYTEDNPVDTRVAGTHGGGGIIEDNFPEFGKAGDPIGAEARKALLIFFSIWEEICLSNPDGIDSASVDQSHYLKSCSPSYLRNVKDMLTNKSSKGEYDLRIGSRDRVYYIGPTKLEVGMVNGQFKGHSYISIGRVKWYEGLKSIEGKTELVKNLIHEINTLAGFEESFDFESLTNPQMEVFKALNYDVKALFRYETVPNRCGYNIGLTNGKFEQEDFIETAQESGLVFDSKVQARYKIHFESVKIEKVLTLRREQRVLVIVEDRFRGDFAMEATAELKAPPLWGLQKNLRSGFQKAINDLNLCPGL